MTRFPLFWRAGLLSAWAVFALLALWGVGTVPFHPDESTFLYMSRDFDLLVLEGQPGAVSWQAEGQPGLVQRYRLLDAPMGRYLAGLGRALASEPPLAQDWNWSATWEANADAGALPGTRALAAARWPAALLSALSVGLVFGIGHRLGGPGVGITAALLYALSGLLLLHGRRAMSEGPLLFFSLLTAWALLRERPNPWLAGLALAAAVAAKLTALTLLPVAIVALFLPDGQAPLRSIAWRPALGRLALFGGVSLMSLWALHPSLWSEPIAGLQAMQAARQTFFAEQAAFIGAVAPHALLTQPGLRVLGMLYHVYFAPLAFGDVGQYAAATAAAELRYQAGWINQGWHSSLGPLNQMAGAALLALSLAGLLLGSLRWWPRRRGRPAHAEFPRPSDTRAWLLLVVWSVATVVGLLAVAVPAQRYYLPLVPIASLWAAQGFLALARPLRVAFQLPRREPVPTHD